MKYEMKASRINREYVVEAIGQDGEVYVTTFSGPDAEQRAKEYAVWKTERTAYYSISLRRASYDARKESYE